MAYKEVYRHQYNGDAWGKAYRYTAVEYYEGISTWDDIHDGAATGLDNTVGASPIRNNAYKHLSGWRCRISRGMVWFDANLGAGDVITAAKIRFSTSSGPIDREANLYFVTANDVEPPVELADYVTLKDKTTIVATVPGTELAQNTQYEKDWDSNQFDKIQHSGLTGVGIRLYYDLYDVELSDPPNYQIYDWSIDDAFYLLLWYYSAAIPYFLWGEGEKLDFIDHFGAKRRIEGIVQGATSKDPYQISGQGQKLGWIDTDGNERRVLGDLGMYSGKTTYQKSVQGTKLAYIDKDDNERYLDSGKSPASAGFDETWFA